MDKGYKNCYYDNFKKTIYLKEFGDTKYQEFPFEFDYYAIDPTKKSDIEDCWGNRVKRVVCKDKKALTNLQKSGARLCESDIGEVTKFMHERYDFKELSTDATQFRLCYYDIETQTSCRQDRRMKVRVKHKVTGEESEHILKDIDRCQPEQDDYLFWDYEKEDWRIFKKSCFFKSEFPKPAEAKYPINLIAAYSTVDKILYQWGLEPYEGDSSYVMINKIVKKNVDGKEVDEEVWYKQKRVYKYFEDEYALMKDFVKWFNKQDFDWFTGWNSDGFDLHYIINRISNLEDERGLKHKLGNGFSPLLKEPKAKVKLNKGGEEIGTTINIPGLYTIDYMDLYKKFGGQRSPSYKLDYICKTDLGVGKLEYDGAIFEIYKKDWNKYADYNAIDTLRLPQLDEKKGLISIAVDYALDCVIPLDKVFSMIAAVEGYILKFIHRQNKRMNDKRSGYKDWWKYEKLFRVKKADGNYEYQNCNFEDKGETTFPDFAVKAGYCYADPGRYGWVISGDIQSSYPHQIMMYNISPETKVVKPTPEQIESGEVIQSELNGIGFRRTEHAILPDVIRAVFAERLEFKGLMKDAKKAGDKDKAKFYDTKQNSKKLIINSCYGVCLNENFHFFDIDCARAITRGGRQTIRYLQNCTNKYFTSQQMLMDAVDYFPSIKIRANNKDYYYKRNDDITVMREKQVINIKAYEFNEETDLLGIED